MKIQFQLKSTWAALAITLAGACLSCDGKKAPISEHNRGYNEGVRETRQAQNDAGVIGAAVQESKGVFGAGKEGKSADYNAGYRKGIKEELKQSYPQK